MSISRRSPILPMVLAATVLAVTARAATAQGGTPQGGTSQGGDQRTREAQRGSQAKGSPPEMEADVLDEILGETTEGSPPATDQGAAAVLKSAKGYLETRARSYFRDRSQGRNDGQWLVEGELELDFQFTEELTGFFRPRVYLDLLDGDLQRFEPFEAYVTHKGDGFDLRIGQFVENWGIADTHNPIDVINRRDLATDLLDPDRLGESGGRLRWFLPGGDTIGEPTVSLYYLPVWRPTPFAPEDQRFSFAAPGRPFDEDLGFEPGGFDRSFFATRFQSTLTTAPFNADLQLLVARGPERMPTLFDNGGTQAPAYFGAWTFGAGLRAVPNQDVMGSFLSKLTFKLETAYKRPYNFDDAPIAEPDDYLSYVVGVDREFFDVFKDQDRLTLTLEYAGEEGADDRASLLRPFRNDAIVRAFWEANDFSRTSLELRGIVDLDTDEFIFEAIFERQLRSIDDDLKLIVQLQVFEPPENGQSVFDFFPNNSSAAIALRWDF